MTVGTDLYQRTIDYDYSDQESKSLMAKVWGVTPWMINVHTGSPGEDSYRAIVHWCREEIGPEAWPIHERPGEWQTGSATLFGETFIGFRTEEQMDRFCAKFGDAIR